ncbi:virulence-associated E family protein [Roseinatronobacter bogoriensis]|nr:MULTISPECIES: virulence-associated E family protein [Rhodobaca]MBB4209328.1 putative P-loop ATPase [Rhodobaca bogoriensis DSM 18756]TDW34338.1 virulence-associated protein E [Rhodobaca barguzinensis]TDY67071.1 virulence-associated protein E [Rhodobaca bogoriensis DSM 18756]
MPMRNRFEVLSAQLEIDQSEFNNSEGAHEDKKANEEIEFIVNKKGDLVSNVANAIALISSHHAWAGALAFNEFTRERVLLQPIPGQKNNGFPRKLEDEDYTAAQMWFNANGLPIITKDAVVAALRKCCRDAPFDPLREFLEGLTWDREKRLGRWLTTYCGVDYNAYTAEVGLRWAVSAVARALKPGCKADHMLVFEGMQGQRKSTVLSTLAGESFFSDNLPPMQTKDASSFLRGKWIIEVAELDAMRRDIDGVKAFISRQVESYRPAYGREEVSEPRRCVFAGTTNKSDWQRDETGGRRFWPVKVGLVDIEGLERDREQLWAEAVALYLEGERWWLEGDVAELALSEASDRTPEDPWRSEIANILEDMTEITTKQVLGMLGILSADMTPALSKRVARELVALGWEKTGRITAGEYKGAARYMPVPAKPRSPS